MKNMAVNRWSGLALSLFAVAATACQQLPSFAFAADADQPGHVDDGAVFTADGPLAVLIGKNAEGKPLMDVAVPPGVDGSLITPRTGEMLERAMLPVSKIVPQLARPDYLPKAGAAQTTTTTRMATTTLPPLSISASKSFKQSSRTSPRIAPLLRNCFNFIW